MHGLLKALVDDGWSVGLFRDYYCVGRYPEIPQPVLSDEVYFEMYRMDGKDPKTYRKNGPTMWEAMCNTIASCQWVQEQVEKLPLSAPDSNQRKEGGDE
jgi:hypothetical protein